MREEGSQPSRLPSDTRRFSVGISPASAHLLARIQLSANKRESSPLPAFFFFLPNRRKRGVSSLFDLLRIVSILNSFSNFCSPCRVSHNKKLEKLIHAAFRISITDRDSRAHGKHVAFASWQINCPPVASPLAEFEISLPSPLPYLLKCKLLPYLSYIALSSVLSTTYLPLVFIKLDFTSREEERRGEER